MNEANTLQVAGRIKMLRMLIMKTFIILAALVVLVVSAAMLSVPQPANATNQKECALPSKDEPPLKSEDRKAIAAACEAKIVLFDAHIWKNRSDRFKALQTLSNTYFKPNGQVVRLVAILSAQYEGLKTKTNLVEISFNGAILKGFVATDAEIVKLLGNIEAASKESNVTERLTKADEAVESFVNIKAQLDALKNGRDTKTGRSLRYDQEIDHVIFQAALKQNQEAAASLATCLKIAAIFEPGTTSDFCAKLTGGAKQDAPNNTYKIANDHLLRYDIVFKNDPSNKFLELTKAVACENDKNENAVGNFCKAQKELEDNQDTLRTAQLILEKFQVTKEVPEPPVVPDTTQTSTQGVLKIVAAEFRARQKKIFSSTRLKCDALIEAETHCTAVRLKRNFCLLKGENGPTLGYDDQCKSNDVIGTTSPKTYIKPLGDKAPKTCTFPPVHTFNYCGEADPAPGQHKELLITYTCGDSGDLGLSRTREAFKPYIACRDNKPLDQHEMNYEDMLDQQHKHETSMTQK